MTLADNGKEEVKIGSADKPPRALVVVSVEAEKDAVLRGLAAAGAASAATVDVIVGGVGAAMAAAGTAEALAVGGPYSLVVCAGIAGGFADRAPVGTIVVADRIVAADLGAESPDGFIGLDELGFGSARIATDAGLTARLAAALQAAGRLAVAGPVLTVTTATGTAASAEELARRIPGAAAEGMEGYGAAAAAQRRGVPVIELRAVSNEVGPRDRSAWRIKEALQALESASAVLLEVLQ